MALTPEKRKALTLARYRIAASLDDYVCFALDEIGRKFPSLEIACNDLRIYILQSLRQDNPGCFTLQQWQQRHGICHLSVELRDDRLAWIDWMLGDEL
ncbi:hypothetical protein [Burkholderia gladioli]|uniref:hypothetical protein n=1 Tax=Burkholderia gladioli TaxID=28095 RepID=UPI0016407D79|nr:hypothetical protein [Burkholderia gladioli]